MNNYETVFDTFISAFSAKTIENQGTAWQTAINPDDVFNSPGADNSDTFWSQHGENVDRYKELILNYQQADKEIKQHGNLDHLRYDSPISMAYQAFHGSEPITLTDYDGKLMINGNGRHRIEAAKRLRAEGYDVKLSALVTKWQTPSVSKEKTGIISSNSLSNSSSMSHQIENQIELLKQAKSLFSDHAEKIEELTQNFNAAVRGLEQDELNHDYMDFLEEFLADYVTKLKTIRETIEEEYMPLLNRKIQYLEDRV
jgi:hypothetical protein